MFCQPAPKLTGLSSKHFIRLMDLCFNQIPDVTWSVIGRAPYDSGERQEGS